MIRARFLRHAQELRLSITRTHNSLQNHETYVSYLIVHADRTPEKARFSLHLISMHSPRILGKTPRPITAIQLLRRYHLLQHSIIVNRTRPNHPNRRLALRFNPHDTAALLTRVGSHGIAGIGGAGESLG